MKADVTKAEDVEAAVAKCVSTYSRLDILLNNAGISVESTHPTPHGIHQLSESDWDLTMSINVKGVFLGCKYGITQMLKQDLLPGTKSRGWVVNTASVQGLVAYFNTRELKSEGIAGWTDKESSGVYSLERGGGAIDEAR